MVTPEVWVSTTSPDIIFDDEAWPGDHWTHVGTINTTQESEFFKHIQVMLGYRNTAPRSAEFYLSGSPDNEWVRSDDHPPFWIAIDPWGAMRSTIHGAKPTYFVSTQKAVVTPLTRRPPEPHPGNIVKPIMVPIRLKRTAHGVLTKHAYA